MRARGRARLSRGSRASRDKKAPHFLAEHAWRLAQAFSKFYAACPILTAPPAVRASRLSLAKAMLDQLELALGLLGIETPERM